MAELMMNFDLFFNKTTAIIIIKLLLLLLIIKYYLHVFFRLEKLLMLKYF